MYHIARSNRENIKPGTVVRETFTWKRFFEGTEFSKKLLKDITVYDIENFFQGITKQGVLDIKVIKRVKGVLNGIYYESIAKGYITTNIVKDYSLKRLRYPIKEKKTTYGDEELLTLLNYVKSLPQTTYTYDVRFAFCFPLRIGELRAITWDDIDWDNRLLHIHSMVVKTPNGQEHLPYTKNHKDCGERYLPIVDEALEVLTKLKEYNGNKEYVFQSSNGGKWPISEERFNDHLKAFCEACGVTLSLKSFSSFLGCTKLYEAGVPIKSIQKAMGHADKVYDGKIYY